MVKSGVFDGFRNLEDFENGTHGQTRENKKWTTFAKVVW